MKMKTVSLLLVCLVAVSLLCAYGSTALAQRATQAIDAAPSRLLTVTEKNLQNANSPFGQLVPLGDSVDDPIPHTH